MNAPAPLEKRRACPECGGHLHWSAAARALQCQYCGTKIPAVLNSQHAQGGDENARPRPKTGLSPLGLKRDMEGKSFKDLSLEDKKAYLENLIAQKHMGDYLASQHEVQIVAEQDLLAALADPANLRGWGAVRHEVQCGSCGAISVFVEARAAQRCDFCGSPAIVKHEGGGEAVTPQSVLPFEVSQTQVRQAVRQWYGSRWFAPNALARAALTDTLHGVYLPYWTFDAQVQAHWQAEAGYYYYTQEVVRSASGELQTRQVRHVRWEPAAGQLAHFFDDELVPGTVGVHTQLLRQVEPFPTRTDLRPYSPEFVRGWTVERYQVDLSQAAKIGQSQMDATLRQLCAARVPGDIHRNLQVMRQYTGQTFKHILVPIWLVSYTYGRDNYQIVVNGYSGKIAGEYPKSWPKIIGAILAVFTLVILAVIFLNGRGV